MEKDPKFFLKHIIDSINLLEGYLENLSKDKFIKSQSDQDKIERRLEIIGEAVTNIPDNIKQKYPDVQWRQISDTRNKLIHDYFSINPGIVWNITQKNIPPLKKQIKKILKDYR